jgi:hypothetical protein
MAEQVTIPVVLRSDVTAHINVPRDLSKAEAERIALVVLASAVPDDAGKQS